MAGQTTRSQEIGDQTLVGLRTLLGTIINPLIDDVEKVRNAAAYALQDQVVYGATPNGLSVDTNAADVELDAACIIQNRGVRYAFNAETAIDISAMAGGGATVATSKAGALWIFGNIDGTTAQAEVDVDAQAHDSAIISLAQYSIATNALPPSAAYTCVGIVSVVEGGSGTFTWGTGSITDETEIYYSLNGAPGILTACASMALDAGAATFTYGAGVLRLGSATTVSYTGKANATIGGSDVADGAVGAWLFYVLADDSECAVQVGAAYASLEAARAAIAALKPNPLMPLVAAIYVENASGAAFDPGTTDLDAEGITATFDIKPCIATSIDFPADLTAPKFGNLSGVAVS